MMTATYSFEDNKLRLYSVNRLEPEVYDRIKALGFIWAPKQQLFVAPMWTPGREAVLIKLAGNIENEDVSLEQRAIDRAERFEKYSESRAKDSNRCADAADEMSGAFYMGQPILIGHHSEKKARKLQEKIHNNMSNAVKFSEQSSYWASRSKDVIAHAARRERPAVRIRRIKKLESEQRSHQREIDKSQKFIKLWSQPAMTPEYALNLAGYDRMALRLDHLPPLYEGHNGFFSVWDILKNDKAPLSEILPRILRGHETSIEREQVWVNHLQRRIDYEKECLKESGHEMPDFKAIAAARRKASTSLPIVNHPGPGIAEVTKAKWSDVPNDYKAVRKSKCGTYRYRVANERSLGVGKEWGYPQVFITDQKRVDIPTASEVAS